jgi:hypothetical protein
LVFSDLKGIVKDGRRKKGAQEYLMCEGKARSIDFPPCLRATPAHYAPFLCLPVRPPSLHPSILPPQKNVGSFFFFFFPPSFVVCKCVCARRHLDGITVYAALLGLSQEVGTSVLPCQFPLQSPRPFYTSLLLEGEAAMTDVDDFFLFCATRLVFFFFFFSSMTLV